MSPVKELSSATPHHDLEIQMTALASDLKHLSQEVSRLREQQASDISSLREQQASDISSLRAQQKHDTSEIKSCFRQVLYLALVLGLPTMLGLVSYFASHFLESLKGVS